MTRNGLDTFIVDLVARPEYSSMAKEVLTKGREKKEFIEFSQIPVLTPAEFLDALK